MEPVTVVLIVVVGLFGVIGGFGARDLVSGPDDDQVVVRDESRVEEQKTEQAYSLERVLAEVCARTDPDGVELCDLLTCRQQSRPASGGVAESTCDSVSNVAASRRAHAYCVAYAKAGTGEDRAARASAETACLTWFAARK